MGLVYLAKLKMKERIYQTKVHYIDELRQRLIDVWGKASMMQLTSSRNVSVHLFAPKEDTLSI